MGGRKDRILFDTPNEVEFRMCSLVVQGTTELFL